MHRSEKFTLKLCSVWGSGPNDVWMVGENGAILHWNGSKIESMPKITAKFLNGVWGSSANDVTNQRSREVAGAEIMQAVPFREEFQRWPVAKSSMSKTQIGAYKG